MATLAPSPPVATRRSGALPVGAVTLGADYRALGVVRSLGRRGVPACVLREPGEPLASLSRYAGRSLPWPAPGEDRVAFLEHLARREGLLGWALIPTSDEAAALVARHHETLRRQFVLGSPPWEVVRWAYDKRLTYRLAEQLGIAHPRTAYPRTVEEARSVRVPFPAVLKPAYKVASNPLTVAKAWRVEDADELARRYGEACALVEPEALMVQELVPGGGEGQLSYAALCREGEPLAALTARRTRQYPADFGRASTYVETLTCPDIVAPSLRLLREIRFTGLVELEYKRRPADGVPLLLDVNPRVWGWHTLCARAGVDFPHLLWLLLRGEPIPPTRPREGVGWLRLTTDAPTALRELAAGRLAPAEYARTLRRPREAAIFAWDDPLPGACELPLVAALAGRRLLRGDPV